MDLSTFKQLVVDYMNRDGVAFDVDSAEASDKVLEAANNAKAYAQKLIRFEKARTYVQVQVDRDTGGDLSTAVLLADGVTPCNVKSIENAFVKGIDNDVWYKFDVVTRGVQLERDFDVEFNADPRQFRMVKRPQVIKDGDTIWVSPWPTDATGPITVKLRIIRWMPEYGYQITGIASGDQMDPSLQASIVSFTVPGGLVGQTFQQLVKAGEVFHSTNGSAIIATVGGSSTTPVVQFPGTGGGAFTVLETDPFTIKTGVQSDFFLEECRDWLLYRCIQELNFFLKEDQRIILSNKVVNESWEAMKSWNAELAGTNSDLDLD